MQQRWSSFLMCAMLVFAVTSPARAERDVIVTDADRLAPPELRANEPTPGKWWLNPVGSKNSSNR